MLPIWAYGFWQSRLQYKTQQEMLDVASKYRDLKIPLDNLVLDFYWMQRMGSHQFTSKFPRSGGDVPSLCERCTCTP